MRLSWLGRGLALALAACGAPVPERFALSIDARDEGDAPLEGVRVWIGDREIGATDRDGRAVAEQEGRTGDRLTLSFTCPAGRRTEVPVRTVPLRRVASASGSRAAIEARVVCSPVRSVVPLVVAATGPGDLSLPVTLDGEVVAHTDAAGTAHALVELEPGAVVRIGLHTESRPDLRPRDPSHTVRIEDAGTILLVAQRFEPAPRRARRARGPQLVPERPAADPARPYRIH